MLTSNNTDVYTDINSLTGLRKDARQDPQASLRKVARQFESMYLKMMLKSMRDASGGDPLFDSSDNEVYRDMYDNQLALSMSEHGGIGLADMLVRQLQHDLPKAPHAADGKTPVVDVTSPAVAKTASASPVSTHAAATSLTTVALADRDSAAMPERFASPEEFIEKVWPLAEQAGRELQVPPHAVLAQAALESGWGQHVTTSASGSNTHNLFNIKADADWKGPKVVIDTVEYDHGVAKRQKAAFRAYGSYAEAFRDYVRFLKSNPRYQAALHQSQSAEDFARNLHLAGYATDPAYAHKLIDIMQRQVPGSPQSAFLAAAQG